MRVEVLTLGIRNSAKAIIIRDGQMLVNKNMNTLGAMCYGLPNGAVYYDLPGGGQNQYEPLMQAVCRECAEETGYAVAVDRLAAIYEEISVNADFRAHYEQYAHKVFFVFVCHQTGEPVREVTEKDLDMLGSEWVSIADAMTMPLNPLAVRDGLARMLRTDELLNLGSGFVD